MTPEEEKACNYLGFDLSTQKLKAVLLSCKLIQQATAEVTFDTDLPEYSTSSGFCSGPNANEYYVHPVMWIKATHMILDRLVANGADFKTVCAIGGSAQQHGSVYWSRQGIEVLHNLDPEKELHSQLDETAFAVTQTPIWMDGSTERQCHEMEESIGGRTKMVTITGSKCYERFTGPQIRKIYQLHASAYENTKRISLVSSFLASLFLGDVAPIDFADASGMNLFDIKSKSWSKVCLKACAPDLEKLLGEPVKTCSIVGSVSNYFVKRFSFPETCKVAAFTGEKPSALSGMLAEQNLLVISLGTTDTIMMNLQEPSNLEEAQVLCNPIETKKYMGILCFRNASLVRNIFQEEEANKNWKTFNEMLDMTPCGNNGQMALHFHSKEIIPCAKGVLRWKNDHSATSHDAKTNEEKFDAPSEVRALIEGQMLHRRAVATDMGFHFGENTKIIATGGASVNKSILQVVADVFHAPVYTLVGIYCDSDEKNASEAALLGAAYRAKYALYAEAQSLTSPDTTAPKQIGVDDGVSNITVRDGAAKGPLSYYDYIVQNIPHHMNRICIPEIDSEQIYAPMLDRYREMARILVENSK